MRGAVCCTLGLALAAAGSAACADWSDFYVSAAPVVSRTVNEAPPDEATQRPRPEAVAGLTAMDDSGRCIAAILQAQDRYGIPDNILLGIGLQEAGVTRGGQLTVWPWAVNAAGTGRLFDSRADAMQWVRERQASGVQSIDVGCLQINLRWHPTAFATLDEGFDPTANTDYAARFLRSLYAETGDWMRAAGAYHSRTPAHADVYLASLRRNVAVANDRIGSFHAIAGPAFTGTMDVAQATLPEDLPPDQAQVAAWGHGLWSVQNDDPGGAYGIYSRDRIEPVLPNFQQVF